MDILKKPTFGIIAIWLSYLLMLGVLQLSGMQLGFNVFPLGEDRNWINFIINSTGVDVIHKYWDFLDRNPLSPWVWWFVSPLIKWSDFSLYVIRKCADPLLAITVFLLLDRIGKQQCRTFAFSVAIITLFWNFSAYYEHFMWAFHVAFALSLLSIFFYCRYVDNDRQSVSDFSLALLCYLISIAIYTLHCGAIFVILLLSLFRNNKSPNFLSRIKTSAKDIIFFAAVFVIYNCLWLTVSRDSKTYYVLYASTLLHNLNATIHQFIFPNFYSSLYHLTLADFSLFSIVSILVASFFLFFIMYKALYKFDIIDTSTKFPVLWSFGILLGISLPIIILESTSPVWVAGTRSLMTYQVWHSLLYVSLIFLLINLLPVKNKINYVITAMSVFGAITILGGLDYNHRVVKRTYYQTNLMKGLKSIPVPAGVSPNFLVKLENPNEDMNIINPVLVKFGQTLLRDNNASLRVISATPLQSAYWRIGFQDDNTGVINASDYGDLKPVPYKSLWIVFFDGEKVTLPSVINQKDFSGLQVDWKRSSAINQEKIHQAG